MRGQQGDEGMRGRGDEGTKGQRGDRRGDEGMRGRPSSSPPHRVSCLSALKIDSLLFLPLMFSRYEFSRDDEAPSRLIINRRHVEGERRGRTGGGWVEDGGRRLSALA